MTATARAGRVTSGRNRGLTGAARLPGTPASLRADRTGNYEDLSHGMLTVNDSGGNSNKKDASITPRQEADGSPVDRTLYKYDIDPFRTKDKGTVMSGNGGAGRSAGRTRPARKSEGIYPDSLGDASFSESVLSDISKDSDPYVEVSDEELEQGLSKPRSASTLGGAKATEKPPRAPHNRARSSSGIPSSKSEGKKIDTRAARVRSAGQWTDSSVATSSRSLATSQRTGSAKTKGSSRSRSTSALTRTSDMTQSTDGDESEMEKEKYYRRIIYRARRAEKDWHGRVDIIPAQPEARYTADLEHERELYRTLSRCTTTRLNLNKMCMREIPHMIFSMNITELYLSDNELKVVPVGIDSMTQLRALTLCNNQIEVLPPVIGNLVNLFVLSVRGNNIKILPSSLGNLKKLLTLLVDNNQLTELPQELIHLESLRTLEFHGNPLTWPHAEVLRGGSESVVRYLKQRGRGSGVVNIDDRKKAVEPEVEKIKTGKEATRALERMEKGFDGAQEEHETLMNITADDIVRKGGWNYDGKMSYPTVVEFFHSIRQGNYLKVKDFILDFPIIVNKKDMQGWAPIHEASKYRQVEIVTMLVEAGCDANALSNKGKSAIMIACENGDSATVEVLMDAGVDIKNKTYFSQHHEMILHCAARGGNRYICEMMVNTKRLRLDQRDDLGNSALHTAAHNGALDCVRFLIKHLDRDLKTFSGHSPLHTAVLGNHIDVVRLLLQAGCDIDAIDADKRTPLLMACKNRHVDLIPLLVLQNADVCFPDTFGRTPLMELANWASAIEVTFLMEHGAYRSIDYKDNNGKTALHEAAKRGAKDIVKLLVMSHAQVNVYDSDGRTPSDVAFVWGFDKVGKFLYSDAQKMQKGHLKAFKKLQSKSKKDEEKGYMQPKTRRYDA